MKQVRANYKLNGKLFGETIRRLMAGKIDVPEIAARMGKSEGTAYSQLRGNNDVTLGTAKAFCSALDITLKELMREMDITAQTFED